MAALHAAFALEEVHEVSVGVAEDLELDVPRAARRAFRNRRAPSAKAACPTRRVSASAAGRSSARSTRAIPFPPPPAEAFTSTGYPISFARKASASSESAETPAPSDPSEPGTTGTPAARIRARAASLSPIFSIASGGGPIQSRSASETARANPRFSERNPYPGWIASAPSVRAAPRIRSTSRYAAPGPRSADLAMAPR